MDVHEAARGKLLAWLHSASESVLVLQGFAGLGKSWLARELALEASMPVVQILVPTGSLGQEDILFEIAGALEGLGDYAMTARADGDLSLGLLDALKNPKLIIIDDFQELISTNSANASGQLMTALARASSLGLPGRVLLVSNRTVSFNPHPNSVGTLTLVTPDSEKAIIILDSMLETHGVVDEVPPDLKGDVVAWMGCNPRALQVLAICLRSDPLEELIDAEPESWAERHQGMSGRLVERLEARMLARTLKQLDAGCLFLLNALSVYRIPFDKVAFTYHAVQVGDVDGLHEKLTDHFLLENHRGWYSLQPIARLLSISALNKNDRVKAQCHEIAAKYYSRHFQSLDTSQQFKHGREFVEARYHLITTGQDDAFQRIAAGMRRRLLDSLQGRNSLPSGERERNELLAVLAAALHDTEGGYGRLRYLLARLLVGRGNRADRVVAMYQMRQCVVADPLQDHWNLYIQLAGALEGPEAAVRATARAMPTLSASARVQVYIVAAKTLAELDRLDLAADLTSEGVDKSDADDSVSLTQLHSGLLLRQGKYHKAREMALSRFKQVRATNPHLFKAIECVLYPALARGDEATIRSFRSLLPTDADSDEKRRVCDALILQVQGRYRECAELLDDLHSPWSVVGSQCAFSWLAAGDVDKAVSAASRHSLRKNAATDWLVGVLALRQGRGELAAESMSSSLGRHLSQEEVTDPNLWLRVWDFLPTTPRVYPAYFFPRLPGALTGLTHDLLRLEDKPSPLAAEVFLALPRLGSEDEDDALDTGPAAVVPISVSFVNQIAPNVGSIEMAREKTMGDKYETGVAGVVGKGATASHFEVHGTDGSGFRSNDDLQVLAEELRKLRQILTPNAADETEQHDLQMLEIAEMAAIDGDGEKAVSHLKQVSKWALGAATAIGTTVAAAALKAAVGL